MIKTVRATVRKGTIEPLEPVELSEGAPLLLTLLEDDDAAFWRGVSQPSLDAVWDNEEDDVYAQLLQG